MNLWSKARGLLKRFQPADSPAPSHPACNHASVPHQPGTPEFELYVARQELKAGNLEHGARHLAELLSFDPANPEWLQLLGQYLDRVGNDDLKLYSLNEPRYFADEAVRAYIWARQGRLAEALDLLFQAAQAKPGSKYMDAWALDWLENPQALAALPGPTVERVLAHAVSRFPEARWARTRDLVTLERYVALASRVPTKLRSSPSFHMLHAGLLRKLGKFPEALAVARDSTLVPTGWHSLVAEGLALREQGDYELAAASFERALAFDPDDGAARLEAADGYLTHGVWDKALGWYAQVLQRQPEHPWALPSVLFCRWKTSGDEAKREHLIKMARGVPPNHRAAQLLRLNEPYIGVLPLPADAIAKSVRSIARSFRDKPAQSDGEIAITVSHLESPSATLALRKQMRAMGHTLPVRITVKHIPTPDPRQPCREIRYQLWSYAGTDATRELPAPPPAILQIVTELASNPYDRDQNFQDAKIAARQLNDEHIPQLLAAMVHPPAIPPHFDALEWLPRVQLSAAQVIAHIGSNWRGSVRRDALRAVLFGPRDWTTVAAIITLSHLAQENPELAPDVHEAFETLQEHIPDGGYCCFAHALATCWQWLPHLSLEEKRLLHERQRALEES